ncbi:MAG: hypothetical protein HEQ19_00615 [Gloeotrichia echinulata CP02]
MISTASKANAPAPVPGIDRLKQNVVKSFLQQANDPKSSFHKKLVQLNLEKTDGRNQNGVLPKTFGGSIKIDEPVEAVVQAGSEKY